MPELPDEVRSHYERDIDEGERLLRGAGQLELLRTQEIIRRHLPPGRLRILDVGGGTGAHAAWLADEGHDVHVIDPVARHVDQARRLAQPQRRISAEVGDARELALDDASFDVVLLLGPLYHLTDAADRLSALGEARRVVRPEGTVVVAAISRFASLIDGLSRGYLFDPAFRAIVENDLECGVHENPDGRAHWFTTAYFHHPDELAAELTRAGLEPREVLGVEGVAGWFTQAFERWDDPGVKEAVMFAARATEAEPALMGASAHLLAVARRPA